MEEVKTMTFSEYWAKYKTPPKVLAERTGINYSRIYHLTKKGYTSFEVAVAIELYTNGMVQCISMLPPKKLKKIKRYIESKKEEPRT